MSEGLVFLSFFCFGKKGGFAASGSIDYLSVVFVTGRGGAGRGFTRQTPPLHRAGGTFFSSSRPAPPLSGA